MYVCVSTNKVKDCHMHLNPSFLSFRPEVSHMNQAIYDNSTIPSTTPSLSLQMSISLSDSSLKKTQINICIAHNLY